MADRLIRCTRTEAVRCLAALAELVAGSREVVAVEITDARRQDDTPVYLCQRPPARLAAVARRVT